MRSLIPLLLAVTMAQADDTKKTVDLNQLWDFQDTAATRGRFEALQLEVKTQIARTLGLEGRFDEAHKLLDEVERRLETAPAVVSVRYLLERGRTFNSSGKKESASELFQQAWELARDHKEPGYAVDALHMLGAATTGKVKLAWEEQAVAYAENTGDERALRWLGTLYNNMTWSYHDIGEVERGLAMAKKSEAWQRERHKDTRGHRIARWSVGRMLRANKRYDDALELQLGLEAEYEKLGEKDGFVQEELGEIHLATGDKEQAQPYFARAYEILKDSWVKSDKHRMERMKTLAGK